MNLPRKFFSQEEYERLSRAASRSADALDEGIRSEGKEYRHLAPHTEQARIANLFQGTRLAGGTIVDGILISEGSRILGRCEVITDRNYLVEFTVDRSFQNLEIKTIAAEAPW